jgi:hypothetical protein
LFRFRELDPYTDTQHGRPHCSAPICAPDLPRPLSASATRELLAAREGRCVLHDLGMQRFARCPFLACGSV